MIIGKLRHNLILDFEVMGRYFFDYSFTKMYESNFFLTRLIYGTR